MNEHSGPVLFHVTRGKKHIQRPCLEKAFHQEPQPLRVDVIQVGLKDYDRLLMGFPLVPAQEEAQEIRPVCEVSTSNAIAHRLNDHGRQGPKGTDKAP